jgi:hypothetical protein
MNKNEQKTVTALYRKYMGPSGNGISDAGLRRLAGWTSFVAGWDAAKLEYSSTVNGAPDHGTSVRPNAAVEPPA